MVTLRVSLGKGKTREFPVPTKPNILVIGQKELDSKDARLSPGHISIYFDLDKNCCYLRFQGENVGTANRKPNQMKPGIALRNQSIRLTDGCKFTFLPVKVPNHYQAIVTIPATVTDTSTDDAEVEPTIRSGNSYEPVLRLREALKELQSSTRKRKDATFSRKNREDFFPLYLGTLRVLCSSLYMGFDKTPVSIFRNQIFVPGCPHPVGKIDMERYSLKEQLQLKDLNKITQCCNNVLNCSNLQLHDTIPQEWTTQNHPKHPEPVQRLVLTLLMVKQRYQQKFIARSGSHGIAFISFKLLQQIIRILCFDKWLIGKSNQKHKILELDVLANDRLFQVGVTEDCGDTKRLHNNKVPDASRFIYEMIKNDPNGLKFKSKPRLEHDKDITEQSYVLQSLLDQAQMPRMAPKASQPPHVKTPLYKHQLQSLEWMKKQEQDYISRMLHPRWFRIFLPNGQHMVGARHPRHWNRDAPMWTLKNFTTHDKRRGGILADEVGMGKTLTMLAHLGRSPGQHLIVVPAVLMDQWVQQIRQHTTLQHAVYEGLPSLFTISGNEVMFPVHYVPVADWGTLDLPRRGMTEERVAYSRVKAFFNPYRQNCTKKHCVPGDNVYVQRGKHQYSAIVVNVRPEYQTLTVVYGILNKPVSIPTFPDTKIVLISVENLLSDFGTMCNISSRYKEFFNHGCSLLLRKKFHTLVIDEAHELTWSNRYSSSGYVKYCIDQLHRESTWCITATPCSRGLKDILIPLNLIGSIYSNPYSNSGLGYQLCELLKERHPEVVHMVERMIRSCMLWNSKALCSLPPIHSFDVPVYLQQEELQVNAKLMNGLTIQMKQDICDFKERQSKTKGFELNMHLSPEFHRQCNHMRFCLCFRKGESRWIDTLGGVIAPERVSGLDVLRLSTKIRKVVEIVQMHPKRKFVIFAQWPGLFPHVKNALQSQGITALVFNGKSSTQHQFNCGSVNCLLLSVNRRSGVSGLDLTGGSAVIFLHPTVDPGIETQAIGRVHRIGQKASSILVYRIWASGTMDEIDMQICERRKQSYNYSGNINDVDHEYLKAFDQLQFVESITEDTATTKRARKSL